MRQTIHQQILICDNCEQSAEHKFETMPPENWVSLQWTTQPLKNSQTKITMTYDFCSLSCLMNFIKKGKHLNAIR